MKIIKANSYLAISSEPVDIPVPTRFELYYSNILLCVYTIYEDKTVDFTYNVNTEIPILTPVHRKLKIEDIYFLLRSRVFPNNPYTAPAELKRLGLEEYDPYKIILRTHGIQPNDCYWIRPSDEDIEYSEAMEMYMDFYRLTPEEREEKYKFKNKDNAKPYDPEAFEGIESFLDLS